jgi:serine/threonine protein kinase
MSLSSNFRRTKDSYEQVCQVGGGTYGDVFKARDRETGDIVALKKIRLEDETEGFPGKYYFLFCITIAQFVTL